MGTYIKLQTTAKGKEITVINREILKCGYISDTKRGPFYSEYYLGLDVAFMNNDPEGWKQMEWVNRPITKEQFLAFDSTWTAIGLYVQKINYLNETIKNNLKIVLKWAWENKEKIDEVQSENWGFQNALEHGIFSVDEICEELKRIYV